MVRNEERLKVLKMVQDGKISVDEATELLSSLDAAPAGAKAAPPPPPAPAAGRRFFRVRVTDTDSGRVRVNIRLPMSVVNAGIKMGMKFAPQVEGLDMEKLTEAINSGELGQIVDVFDEEDGEHVEVFIE